MLVFRALLAGTVRPLVRRYVCRSLPLASVSLSRFFSGTASRMSYSKIERGAPNSLDYEIYFKGPGGEVISPFHDIPLYANDEKTVFNMVVEIPRWTNAKMEIITNKRMNPIKQDTKKGKLRYVKNCFPHHGYIWNYGALPQTWEDPNHVDPHTSCSGDNDPLDVCEIGQRVGVRGEVIQVKVLGIMALIDEGETDWKVLVIDVRDPLATQLNDVDDINKLLPGFLRATYEWFTIYKIPDGKPKNKFAFEGQAKPRDFALDIISATHQQWKKLIEKQVENNKGLACENVSVSGSPYKIEQAEASTTVDQSPAPAEALPLDSEVDKWHYITNL